MSPRFSVVIRKENESDVDAIFEVTRKAFETLAVSPKTEQFIINALRKAGALSLSLIAEINGQIVGHIAFSHVEISDGSKNWYTLGPVSVLPEYQRGGIGQAIIRKGLLLLKSKGAMGCVLVGEPGYYTQFGFKNLPDLAMKGVPQKYVLGLPFAGQKAKGFITPHEAFFVKG